MRLSRESRCGPRWEWIDLRIPFGGKLDSIRDEAFSALDPGTRASMQKLIREVWKETKTTVLFVT